MTVAGIDARLGRVRHIGARIRVAAVKPTLAIRSAPQGTVVVAAVSTALGDGRTGQNGVVVVHIRRAGIARSAVRVGLTPLEADGYKVGPIDHFNTHAVGVASAGLAVTNIVWGAQLHAETTGATLVAVGICARCTRARTVSVDLAWSAPCGIYTYTSTAAGQLCARNAVRTDGTGAAAATSRITVKVEVSTTKVFTIVIHAGTGFGIEVLP
jgi:hypothetical protein